MPPFISNHLIINNRTEVLPYTSNQSARSKVFPRTGVDRGHHGENIQHQFEAAVEDFLPTEDGEFVYLVFRSALDFLLDLEKLDKSDCRLATYREISSQDAEGQSHRILEAAVYLNKRAITKFLRKLDKYIHKELEPGQPLPHQTLISNVSEIIAATIKSFWQEPEVPFPGNDTVAWWEVWLNRNPNEENDDPIGPIRDSLIQGGIQISQRFLKFPEHYVYLMRATAQQLAGTILYTDRLAELRKPKETADFYTYLDKQEQQQWIQDLLDRIDNNQFLSNISICILDTGVNIGNPLLTDFIPQENLDRVNPDWTTADTHVHGHGTAMAGLSLFGDLVDVLGTNDQIEVNYHIESVKLIETGQPHNPDLYGAVTQEAVARAVTLNANLKRMVCMAVTTEDTDHRGRPSSWSSALDQTIFGSPNEANNDLLLFVSSGNMDYNDRLTYPLSNEDCSVHDPAQSFNVLTVGAYTLKTEINLGQFNGAEVLANHGAMSPCNSTSFKWEKDWCRKPDIVFEGGNNAIQNKGVIDPDSLQLLTTSRGGVGRPWLTAFADTSASTALASRFAANLYYHYPTLWPETIRALIVHSANWTPEMLANTTIEQLTLDQKTKLITSVGYGVPNMQKARYSANNSLSMIIERSIKPYLKDGSTIKTDQFHLFDLPWPKDVLEDLEETGVTFTITLSYFIEPNPGKKVYELAASYRSHGLRFKMIGPNESPDAFKARVSKSMREEDYIQEGSEDWILGNQIRDKGSIHKDMWVGTAADLAKRNRIAVYPVGGWWKTRSKHKRYEHSVRYSLVMTIETPSVETDIYTPVLNEITIEL
jgi:hypothetical protein